MKRSSTRWTVAALAAALVLVLGVPASAAAGAWDRAPRTGQADTAARRAKPLPAFAPTERDALTRALDRGRIDPATYALERARALFDLRAVRSRYGDVRRADPREATMILRDLVLRLDELSAVQLRQAHAILARPTDGLADPLGDGYTVGEATPVCSADGCVHYVATTDDSPNLTDTMPANGVPDYVDSTLATLDEVWQREVTDYGYREPKSDDTSTNDGGSPLIDIYIADIAPNFYGYCTTDDPNAKPGSGYQYYDFSAYCVVDNDYAEFTSGANGIEALRVTMAHEFFHAVQYAYDATEDRWFMESSATWIEDEVYDTVNDNLQFLPRSPIGEPQVSVDKNKGSNVYGDWVFHRFLVESAPGGADPAIIRRAWENADGAPGGKDQYSLKAIVTEVEEYEVAPGVNAKFRWAFADFAMWNDVPAALYEEGDQYGIAPPSEIIRITRRRSGASGSQLLDHLTSRYIWFRPGRGVRSDAKLLVRMDGPAYKTGPEASVVVFFKGGKISFIPLGVDGGGDGDVTVKFGKGRVVEVDLVMTNASTRHGPCWTDPKERYSCFALPRDDNMRYRFAANLIQ